MSNRSALEKYIFFPYNRNVYYFITEENHMQNQNVQENKMGVMPIGKLVVTMSLPIVISMLVQALYNIVDSIFVSMISQDALNAVSLAFPAQNLMIGFATGSAVGVNALVSRALGAKDPAYANRVARNGVFVAACCYILFLLFAVFGSKVFFRFQTTNPQIVEYGYEYLLIVCGLSFGIFGEVMLERLLTSTGKTIYTMICQGTGAIINIIFDPIFIFVFDMGIAGAALATVLGQIVACLLALYFNFKKNTDLQLSFKGFRPEGDIIKGICSIGVPSIIMVAVGSVMTFLFNIILYTFTAGGTYTQNVFGIYFKLNSFIFMPIFGMNNGLVPIIAYNYGAQKRERMLQAMKVALVIAAVLMALGTLIFWLIPDQLLGLFITNATAEEIQTLYAIGRPALRLISTHFIIAAISISFNAFFQALGKGTYAMITSICRQLVVLLPAAYVLARIGMSLGNDNLVWFSFPIAEVVSLIVSLLLYRKMNRELISKIGEPA